MKLLVISLCCLLLAENTFSQKWKDLEAKDKIVRFNISDLFPLQDGSISFGYQYFVKNNLAIALDAGYVFYGVTNPNVFAKNRGMYIKPSLRYYPKKKFFLELESKIFLTKVTTTVTDWLGKNCVNEVPSFDEYKQFKFVKKSPTLNIIIGTQKWLLKKYNLSAEPYAGVGVIFNNAYLENEPNSCYGISNNISEVITSNIKKEILPNITLGCRIIKKL